MRTSSVAPIAFISRFAIEPPWIAPWEDLTPVLILRGRPYLSGMPRPMKKIRPKKASAAKLRSWRVTILRNRAHYLGDVQAPDEGAAEAAAVSEFKLSDGQRKRLLVQERN